MTNYEIMNKVENGSGAEHCGCIGNYRGNFPAEKTWVESAELDGVTIELIYIIPETVKGYNDIDWYNCLVAYAIVDTDEIVFAD